MGLSGTFPHELSRHHVGGQELVIGLGVFLHVSERGFLDDLTDALVTEVFTQEEADSAHCRLQVLERPAERCPTSDFIICHLVAPNHILYRSIALI